MMTNDDIQHLLDTDRPDAAIEAAGQRLAAAPADGRTLFILGKALWRTGRRAEACKAYAQSVEILGPDCPAAHALDHAHDISSFFNPDLLNP